MANHTYTWDDPPSDKHIRQAVRCLKNDGVIVCPSDVSWAFCWDSKSIKALQKMALLKPDRPDGQPFSLVCDSVSMISEYVVVENQHYRVLKKSLPGPFTFVLKGLRTLPKRLIEKRKNVGVRIPDSPLMMAIVEELGRPILTSSVADLAGNQISMGFEVEEVFGHGVEMVLDLGVEAPCLETTVVDFTEEEPVILRQGEGTVQF